MVYLTEGESFIERIHEAINDLYKLPTVKVYDEFITITVKYKNLGIFMEMCIQVLKLVCVNDDLSVAGFSSQKNKL